MTIPALPPRRLPGAVVPHVDHLGTMPAFIGHDRRRAREMPGTAVGA
ncbi:hypothetical protein [Streptomyces niveus]